MTDQHKKKMDKLSQELNIEASKKINQAKLMFSKKRVECLNDLQKDMKEELSKFR